MVRDLRAALGTATISNAIVAFTFAATGPMALLFAAAAKGGLGESDIAAWIFGGFFVNGLLSIAFCLYYRQPLALLWTMPGTVLVGQALAHLTLPEVIGAYLVTGALLLVLGLTGVVGRIMAAIPMPVVMGMVAGVLLQFGIDWLMAFKQAFWIALPMTIVFAALLAAPRLARTIPPLIAALVVGLVAAHLTDAFPPEAGPPLAWGMPRMLWPKFTWAAMAELVVPLAVTVLAAQNAQGFAILSQSGHKPPVDSVTTACGAGSLLSAWFGSVPTCLAGPVTAILVAGTPREKHFASGVLIGFFAVLFGLTAPAVARLSIVAPRPLIAALAGLAMLKILQAAFSVAFKGPYSFGALISFLVTFAGIPILNIGSPFWGLVFGYLAARVYDEKP